MEERLPTREAIGVGVERLKSDQAAAIRMILELLEQYTNYNEIDRGMRDHIRSTILTRFAGLHNKFLNILRMFGNDYVYHQLERKHGVPPRATNSVG